MNIRSSQSGLCRAGVTALVLLVTTVSFGEAPTPAIQTQVPKQAIRLEKQPTGAMHLETLPEAEQKLLANMPENFYSFGAIHSGETADVETLTLRFDESAKLTKIASTPDFQLVPGGSCIEGNIYEKDGNCTMLVRFTPQGPGHRLGKLSVTHSAAAEPMTVGLNGYGYAPVASFSPAVISTVAASYPSSAGLFSGARSIAVDDGDGVYVADTGNQKVWYLSSTGTFQSLVLDFGAVAAVGIAVDDYGRVLYTTDSPDFVFLQSYNQATRYGSSTGFCSVGSTCGLSGIAFSTPGALSSDHDGNVFADISYSVAKLSSLGTAVNYTALEEPYTLEGSTAPRPILVDPSDTFYYFDAPGLGYCIIGAEGYYDAINSTGVRRRVAGLDTGCGFSGDGGQARNAEIGASVGQMAMDIAGNLFFTDTANQRVRRIDGATGIITTVAGNGTAGYSGDGGPAIQARLSNPTGLGVDSQGQVYILNTVATTGAPQLLRKLGPNGILSYGTQVKGTTSGAQWVTLANSGNTAMTFTRVFINGNAAADFSIDPNTTTCNLTASGSLFSGQNCHVGILFKPTAAGSRTASLVFLDNTVNQTNTVQLSGTGSLPAPTFGYSSTSPANGATVTPGTTVKFTVNVTSSTSPAPTGTVTFKKNGTAVGSPVTLASGAASVSLTGLTAGTVSLSASYSGDANYAAAGPITRSITVKAASKAAPAVKLAAKTNPATSCTTVGFTVTVTGRTGEYPTGEVKLQEGSKLLATGTLKDGVATLTSPLLSAGTHTLTASYVGDSEYTAASSAGLKETVKAVGECAIKRGGPAPGPRAPGSRTPVDPL